MAPGLDEEFEVELARWEAAGRRRQLDASPAGPSPAGPSPAGPSPAGPSPAGPGAADFVSNDYLGLSRHPAVVAAG